MNASWSFSHFLLQIIASFMWAGTVGERRCELVDHKVKCRNRMSLKTVMQPVAVFQTILKEWLNVSTRPGLVARTYMRYTAMRGLIKVVASNYYAV